MKIFLVIFATLALSAPATGLGNIFGAGSAIGTNQPDNSKIIQVFLDSHSDVARERLKHEPFDVVRDDFVNQLKDIVLKDDPNPKTFVGFIVLVGNIRVSVDIWLKKNQGIPSPIPSPAQSPSQSPAQIPIS